MTRKNTSLRPIVLILMLALGFTALLGGLSVAAQRKTSSTAGASKRRHSRRHSTQPTKAAPEKTVRRENEPVEEDVEGRENWFWAQRQYPFDSIPKDARSKAWASRPKTRFAERIQAENWQPLGPVSTASSFVAKWGTTSGRISAIAISPTNPQLILVGGPTSGIWRSTDGGTTFAPVADNLTDISIGSIAFSASNSQIVYAGAGDGSNRAYFGVGVLKSTDAGQTWARISDATLPTYGVIRQVAVDPTSASTVYAVQYDRTDITTNTTFASGFYRSTDGGVTWTKTLSGLFRNMALQPGTPQTLFLTAKRVDPTNAATPPGVYRSTNGGQNWNLVYTAPFQNTSDLRVAVTAANTQKVYLYEGGDNGGPRQLRVESSSDGGGTWSNVGVRTDIDPGQFDYNTYIFVSPADANTIYIGSRDVFKSTDGGTSFTNIVGNFAAPTFQDYTPDNATTHSDQQTLAFAPNDANTIYVGNDGGLFKSTNGGTTLQSLNNTLSFTQFVGYAIDPTDPTRSYGGTQDNGSQRRQANSTQWLEVIGGDGGNFVVDPLTPGTVFSTYIYGSVTRFTNFGATFDTEVGNNAKFLETADPPRINFYPPFTGNGVDSKLYFGTWRLFISTDKGTTWNPPSGTTDVTQGNGDTLTAIAVAKSNTSTIYVGSSFGNVQVSTNEGVSWTDVTAGLPTRSITGITVSPTNPATAYVTVSGFASGHVFKTTNTGGTWTDISGNLPNIPTNCLLIDPQNANTLYVGTDVGVFNSTAGGNTWAIYNSGMPPVVVTRLVASNNGTIQAATYGRGAYQLATSNTTIKLDATTYSANSNAFQATVNVLRTGDTTAASSVTYATSDGTALQKRDYIVSTGTLNFAAGETTKPITILLVNNFYPGSKTVNISLSAATGGVLDTPSAAILTITNTNAANPTTNPLDDADARFFVRQQYYDFLNRVPDQGGFDYWVGQITACGNDQTCIRNKRIDVSNAFFYELEYQQTAGYVFRLYRAAYGNTQPFPNSDATNANLTPAQQAEARKLPGYGVFSQDRARLIGSANLAQDQLALANAFVLRPEFLAKYPANLTLAQLVDALLATVNTDDGVDLSAQRTALINLGSPGAVIYRLVDDNVQTNPINNRAFIDAEYNRSFVASQYYGYFRRDADIAGFLFWLGQMNAAPLRNVARQHALVCSQITSGEYQQRFSPVATHNNTECGP